jgi:hypothetical protein
MKTGPEITPSSKWVPAQQVTRQTSCGSSQAGNGNWPRRLNGEDSIACLENVLPISARLPLRTKPVEELLAAEMTATPAMKICD